MKLSRKLAAAAALLLSLSLYLLWPGKPLTVAIPEGATAGQAASILKERGIILSPAWFRLLVRVTGTGKRIMPGEYSLRSYMSAEEALWRLTHSVYVSSVKVIIPEGWRLEQTAERLAANGVIANTELFVQLARAHNLEGYLFPSTYHLKKNMHPQEVINLLKSEFDRQVRPLFSKGFAEGLDERKTMIIASIVEREAVEDSERPLIAAVYINRLRRRMPLEADPTTQYAIGYTAKDGYWKKALTYKDLKFKSPYNTYAVGGLPPGPICSPGKASVAATLAPANFDALYFVSDRKGKHIFNSSFQEHLKAKKSVEQALKAAKAAAGK
jgi:UPF0755 protein